MKTPGALHQLPIPATLWTNISMDFIVGITKASNKSVIMVVVDHLSKYAHFCALLHPFTASTVVKVVMDRIFKSYGMPTSIMLDHDPTFPRKF